MANRLKKGSAAAAMAVELVGSFEGLRQNAYPDPATQG
ncbi:lysozyme, partial [Rhizobium ruizarguesonis]